MSLSPNSLSFLALANEYCAAIEQAGAETSRRRFVTRMVRLLPRLYITASDLKPGDTLQPGDGAVLEGSLTEEYYEEARRSVEALIGADDVYLEVFEEDMKYSDTPLSASVAEGLCDIFQVMYNFISMVRDAPDYRVNDALEAVRNDFADFWSQRLVNVMRPLNQLKYNAADDEVEDETDTLDDYTGDGGDDYCEY